jgi:hypothetical protein
MAVKGEGVGVTERVAQVTIAKWIKKVSELTTRKLVILSLLQKKGLINYGFDSNQVRWPIRKDEHQLQGYADMVPINYQRINTKDNAYLPHRGYYLTDTITHREKLENGGPSAILKIFNGREKLIRQSAMRRLNYEFFKDGESASGIQNEVFHGLETFMSGIGAQTASDVLATSNTSSYAGKSCAVGSLGTGDLNRIWTPVIVNTNRNPGSGTITWASGAIGYIRAGLLRATYGNSDEDRPDIVLLTQSSWEDLLNLMDDKERILVSRGSGAQLVSLGFNNVVEVDGCPIMWDVSIPTTDGNGDTVRGYGLTTGQMELNLLGDEQQIFKGDITFNDSYRADNIFVWCLGNIRCESPRNFVKWADIS